MFNQNKIFLIFHTNLETVRSLATYSAEINLKWDKVKRDEQELVERAITEKIQGLWVKVALINNVYQ
ncbi:hypothetical protein BpHYR1_031273 [Brachionus plicatilis]|uniref:Uncharacterized protein n=1 Tax=Brachionus plicatilis TaxID=10195 RepID=A0A3M7R8N9_BRAPC|nr:hypothetical protein BpHYR1_031273 [Brachionus plicatilis]